MHARVLRNKMSPDRVDEGIEDFTQRSLPTARAQDGYAGARLLVNRESGEGMIISFWRDEDAALASAEALRSMREEASTRLGSQFAAPQHFEAAIQHRPKPTEVGNWARVTTLSGDPAKVDDGIRHFETTVVPSVETLPGFRAAILFADRSSGDAIAATVWDSQAHLEASAEALAPIRAAAVEAFGAANPKVENLEVAHAELLAAVGS